MSSTCSALPTAVDLYSGSGAVSQGLILGGFHVVAAVDSDPVACSTYRLNHPSVRLYEEDIKDVSPAQIRREQLQRRNLDLLVICAPCQPFSSQNRTKTIDSRVRLILHAVRFAGILKPNLIFFENVPGLVSPRHAGLISRLRRGLAAFKYHLSEPVKVDAADFGVPQRRLRCIMLAARGEVPAGEHLRQLASVERITVRDAIGNPRRLKSGEKDPDDVLHRARTHQPIALQRLGHIPKDGEDRFALPSHLELDCHRGHHGHPDVYGRMSWGRVAPTLTTGCTDVTRGRFAHPEDDRAITLREAALLQTFPMAYQFSGNASEISTQIGNAVPVRLISSLAPALKRIIADSAVRSPHHDRTERYPRPCNVDTI
jgi:DNA (cytosine-5)-methyltransferase 1